MLKRLNDALPGLIAGILLYGVLVEVIGVWFAEDKLRYTTGLLIGIALACGMAVHMAMVLQDTVATGAEVSSRMIALKSILRYVVVVVVFVVMLYFNLGSLLTGFLGVFGLKVSAYFWPVAHKFLSKMQGDTGVCETPEKSEIEKEVKL